MVKVLLMTTAELENVTSFQPKEGCDDPDFPYYFKLKCSNCGEVSQKHTCIMLSEKVSLPNGRDTTNLVQKCKLCSREGTVTMIPGHGRPLMLDRSQFGGYTPLMMFDCRGLEPVDFSVGCEWKAQSMAGNSIKVVLVEGEFADYCEIRDVPLFVSKHEVKCGGPEDLQDLHISGRYM